LDGPNDAARIVALAHGAGAPMDSPFMNAFAEGLAAQGFRVARFEFPYMAARRLDGRRRPPDPAPVLLDAWRAIIRRLGARGLVIGGKSLGGRMASLLADEMAIAGLICLGYPFHPPDRPETLRTEHLKTLKTPTLILQGERDPFGSRAEVAAYRLSPAIRLHWLKDGDHGFRPRHDSGLSERDNWLNGIAAVAAFITGL
jgi:hypothetical protein